MLSPPCCPHCRRALTRTLTRASSGLQRAGSGLQRASSSMRRLGQMNNSARRTGIPPITPAASLPDGNGTPAALTAANSLAGSLSVPVGDSSASAFQAAADAAVTAAAAGRHGRPAPQAASRPGWGAVRAIARLLPRSRSERGAQAGEAPADPESSGGC